VRLHLLLLLLLLLDALLNGVGLNVFPRWLQLRLRLSIHARCAGSSGPGGERVRVGIEPCGGESRTGQHLGGCPPGRQVAIQSGGHLLLTNRLRRVQRIHEAANPRCLGIWLWGVHLSMDVRVVAGSCVVKLPMLWGASIFERLLVPPLTL